MKRLLIAMAALAAFGAHADDRVAGSASMVVYSDENPGFTQFEVSDVGDSLTGVSSAMVTLQKQKGGFQGFALSRPFNLTCTATACDDAGSTQLHFDITQVAGGYKLEGSMNFVPVSATVTDSEISVLADSSFELTSNGDGSYSGEGASDYFGGLSSFQATLTTSGSLEGLKDPATFIVLVINPSVRR
jgi:hypothetical protein